MIYHFLEKHPILGVFSGFSATVIAYIEPMNHILKFVGSGLGVVIAAVTLYIKVNELKNKKR